MGKILLLSLSYSQTVLISKTIKSAYQSKQTSFQRRFEATGWIALEENQNHQVGSDLLTPLLHRGLLDLKFTGYATLSSEQRLGQESGSNLEVIFEGSIAQKR
ncbi:5817_t:CDS:2, partial [Acaulospora colombiana]